MPGMNAVGTNTERSTRVIAIIGAVTCDIAFSAASAGVSWGSISRMCSTASTTTIASSTKMPIARTNARSDMVLAEKNSANMTSFFFQAEDGIRDLYVTGVQTWLFRSDAFIVKFDQTGVRQWATYYGGAEDD